MHLGVSRLLVCISVDEIGIVQGLLDLFERLQRQNLRYFLLH